MAAVEAAFQQVVIRTRFERKHTHATRRVGHGEARRRIRGALDCSSTMRERPLSWTT
jgi:hypothetical protein